MAVFLGILLIIAICWLIVYLSVETDKMGKQMKLEQNRRIKAEGTILEATKKDPIEALAYLRAEADKIRARK